MNVDPRPSYEQTFQREYRGVPLADCEIHGPNLPSDVFVLHNRSLVLWSEPLACCLVCRVPVRIAPSSFIWDDWVTQQLVAHYLRDHPEVL